MGPLEELAGSMLQTGPFSYTDESVALADNIVCQRVGLVGVGEVPHLKHAPSQLLEPPHDGRRLSWWAHDRCQGMAKEVGMRALVGSRGEVGMSGRRTPDIHRFGDLRRDNTPSPAEFSWIIDSTMSLLELYGGGRKLAKAWAAPSLRCCCFVASPMLTCFSLVICCLPV